MRTVFDTVLAIHCRLCRHDSPLGRICFGRTRGKPQDCPSYPNGLVTLNEPCPCPVFRESGLIQPCLSYQNVEELSAFCACHRERHVTASGRASPPPRGGGGLCPHGKDSRTGHGGRAGTRDTAVRESPASPQSAVVCHRQGSRTSGWRPPLHLPCSIRESSMCEHSSSRLGTALSSPVEPEVLASRPLLLLAQPRLGPPWFHRSRGIAYHQRAWQTFLGPSERKPVLPGAQGPPLHTHGTSLNPFAVGPLFPPLTSAQQLNSLALFPAPGFPASYPCLEASARRLRQSLAHMPVSW